MDTEHVESLVEDLTSNIDDLSDSLSPFLNNALSASSSKLPLLDKAKCYVLATYTLESLLFSSLRLKGVDAKTHPVFQELARVKEYFAKIKKAETAGQKRPATLDKDAAGRFIRAGLAGNEDRDAAKKRKVEDGAVGTHTRFDGAAKRIRSAEGGGDAQGQVEPAGSSGKRSSKRQHQDSESDAPRASKPSKPPKGPKEAMEGLLASESATRESKSDKKSKKKRKKSERLEDERAEEMK